MDYGFAPGTDGYGQFAQKMFAARDGTTLTRVKKKPTFERFIEQLRMDPDSDLPAGNLLTASHASDDGWLLLPLDDQTTAGRIDYEKLQGVATRGTIEIPDTVLDQAVGMPALHMKGCLIGTARPFLKLLKTAVGGVTVTAPKHFHALKGVKTGVFEFMAYSHTVSSPIPSSRPAIIALFKANKKLVDIAGQRVPDEAWELLLPKRITRGKTKIPPNVLTLGQKVADYTRLTDLAGEFRYRIETFPTTEFPGRADVTGETERITLLTDFLASEPDFKTSHEYPVYERLGFDDLASFIKGYKWTAGVKGDVLSITGSRHIYTCLVPITDPAVKDEKRLIFNFYRAGGPDIIGALVESNNVFFATV